jgi:hypothetical protein
MADNSNSNGNIIVKCAVQNKYIMLLLKHYCAKLLLLLRNLILFRKPATSRPLNLESTRQFRVSVSGSELSVLVLIAKQDSTMHNATARTCIITMTDRASA